MLKNISILLLISMLMACVTQTSDKSFKGAGEFDAKEAAKTRVSLGLTYLKNGNFSQAKFNLDKALEFAPRSGQANYAMAFYYQQVDEFEKADSYYKTAIGYSRNDPDVLNSYGAFLCQQGKYKEAEDYFLRAVDDKSYVSAAGTFENLAICAHSQGLTDKAVEYFNSALNHQPTRASSLLYLAQLQTEQGQWDAAKRSLWKYERNSSISAESIFLSYQIANGQQDTEAALKYVDILQSMYPQHENTAKALSQLGKFNADSRVVNKNTNPTVQVPAQMNTLPSEQAASTELNQVVSAELVQQNMKDFKEQSEIGASDGDAAIKNAQEEVESIANEIAETSSESILQEREQLSMQAGDIKDNLAVTSEDVKQDLSQGSENTSSQIEQAYAQADEQADLQEQMLKELLDNQPEVTLGLAQEQEPTLTDDVALSDEINNLASEQVDELQESGDEINAQLNAPEDAMQSTQTALELAQSANSTVYHIVQAKENLYRLSLKYNVKIEQLLEWNNLTDKSSINIGTRLRVKDPNSNE